MTELGELTHVGDDSTLGETSERDRWRVLPGWAVLVASAVAFWVVGFLPWIVEGMHLEISSAWPRFDTIEGPLVALPFGEYAFPALFVSGVVGGTAALAVSRFAVPEVTHARVIAGVGAMLALVISLAQTLLTVRPAFVATDESRLLVGALVVAVLGSGLFGILLGAGVARGSGWPWLLGGATVASLSGSWLVDLIVRGPLVEPQWIARVAQWHPWVSGIALGVVLAVFGFRPATRMVGWLVALAIAWVLPSVLTAATYVVYYFSQGPMSSSHLNEVADAGRDVFVQSLLPSNHVIWPLVLAVVIGIVGATSRLRAASDRRA